MGRVALVFLQIIGYLFSLQPRKVQLFFGSLLGAAFYYLRIRSSIVQQNLSFAFPHSSEKRKEIFRSSYKNLGCLVCEILMVFGGLKRFVRKNVDILGLEHIQEAKRQGRGFFFLSSHLGNWEIMAASGGLLAKADLMLVTKRLKPKWLHEGIEKGRRSCLVQGTYEPKTLRSILSHLKANGAVGFVLDQFTGAPVGVRVPLFGVPVGTSLALATFVKRTGVPVLPVENYRKPDGRWAVIVAPPLKWITDSNSHCELALNTAQYVSVLEKYIVSHPEQWLWIHRRFKGDLTPLRVEEWNEPRVRK